MRQISIPDEIDKVILECNGQQYLLLDNATERKSRLCLAPGCQKKAGGPKWNWCCEDHKGATKKEREAWKKARAKKPAEKPPEKPAEKAAEK